MQLRFSQPQVIDLIWVEFSWFELSWVELNWIDLIELIWLIDWLDWIGLDWIELNWIELNWIDCLPLRQCMWFSNVWEILKAIHKGLHPPNKGYKKKQPIGSIGLVHSQWKSTKCWQIEHIYGSNGIYCYHDFLTCFRSPNQHSSWVFIILPPRNNGDRHSAIRHDSNMSMTSWWFQPSWKIWFYDRQIWLFPQVPGMSKKKWHHHPEIPFNNR